MKSKIRVDVDYDNNPIISITIASGPTQDQDIRDKILERLMDQTELLEAVTTSVGTAEDGSRFTNIELRPIRRSDILNTYELFPLGHVYAKIGKKLDARFNPYTGIITPPASTGNPEQNPGFTTISNAAPDLGYTYVYVNGVQHKIKISDGTYVAKSAEISSTGSIPINPGSSDCGPINWNIASSDDKEK
jgi:hypothetical protein